MPDPSRSAGGTPDDWGNGAKSGGGLCLIMIIAGLVSVGSLVGMIITVVA